jgi:hypothetical protein
MFQSSLLFNTSILRAIRCKIKRRNLATMLGYITSSLGFQGQQNSTNSEQGNASSPSAPVHISCEGYGPRLPRTDLRLRVSGENSDLVRVFGYPPQEDYPKSIWYPPPAFGLEGPYIHYLLGESPAGVKYIMGDGWRSNLQRDPRLSPTHSRQSQVVLRPSVTSNDTCELESMSEDNPAYLAEERAHSLRMRRYGAVAVAVQDDIEKFDLERVIWPRDYFFGWPASGGIWVLRLWLTDSELGISSAEQYRSDEEIMEQNLQEILKREQRYEDNIAIADKVNQQEDMEGVCRVLEEAGARFYAVIEDCPEAVELNLF